MPSATRLLALFALSTLVSACSINGTYIDSTRPDAAKLRYISGNGSATLDLFDSARCEGRTTGILNNLFVPDSRRRADMSVPPPANSNSYYEIRLEPGQPIHVRANTQSANTVCSASFTLTPQAGSEYELRFDQSPGYCQATLVRLQRVEGKDQRLPYPMIDTIPSACWGTSALFPKQPTPLPDTARRTALIDSIIRDSVTPEMEQLTTLRKAVALTRQASPEVQVAARKRELGLDLPEAYWQQYQQNLQTFAEALANLKARTLERYDADSRAYLRSVRDEQLQVWAGGTNDARLPSKAQRMRDMAYYYNYVLQETIAQISLEHLRNMAELDQREGVCKRFAGCWKL